MNKQEIEKLINETNGLIDESDKVMSEVAPLLSALKGIAGNIGVNIKSIGKEIGSSVLGFAKGAFEVATAGVKAHFETLTKEMRISSSMKERMQTAGVPEAAAAAPCAWWVLDAKQRSIKPEEFEVIIRQYGRKLDDESKDLLEDLSQKLEESSRKDAALIIEKWLPVISEALQDYKDKDLPSWATKAAKKAKKDSVFSESDYLTKDLSDEDAAYLILSSQITGDEEKDEGRLAAIFSEDPNDKQKAFIKKLEDEAGKIIDISVFIHAQRQAAGREDGIFGVVKLDGLSEDFTPRIKDAEKSRKKWKSVHKEREAEFGDYEELVKYLKDPNADPDEEDDIETDLSPMEIIMKIITNKSWYDSVADALMDQSSKMIESYGQKIQGAMGQTLAEAVEMTSLSQVSSAKSEVKKSFETFIESDEDLKKAHDYAVENNDDEIGSRIIAMFRPAFASAFIEFVEKSFQIGGPKLDKLISQAESAGYKSSDDPMYQNFLRISEEIKDGVIEGFKSGQGELEKLGEQAQKELDEIMKAKAEEAEEETPEAEFNVVGG